VKAIHFFERWLFLDLDAERLPEEWVFVDGPCVSLAVEASGFDVEPDGPMGFTDGAIAFAAEHLPFLRVGVLGISVRV